MERERPRPLPDVQDFPELFPPLRALRHGENVLGSIAHFEVCVVGNVRALFDVFHRVGGNVDQESAALERLRPLLWYRRYSLNELDP